MRARLLLPVVLLLASVLGAAEVGDPSPPLPEAGWLNQPVETDLARLRGQVLLVELWGIFCPPCLKSLPHLNDFFLENRNRGLHVFALHAQRDHDRARNWIQRNAYTFPSLFDGAVAESFSYSRALPQALVIGPDGLIAFQGRPGEAIEAARRELDLLAPPALAFRPRELLPVWYESPALPAPVLPALKPAALTPPLLPALLERMPAGRVLRPGLFR